MRYPRARGSRSILRWLIDASNELLDGVLRTAAATSVLTTRFGRTSQRHFIFSMSRRTEGGLATGRTEKVLNVV